MKTKLTLKFATAWLLPTLNPRLSTTLAEFTRAFIEFECVRFGVGPGSEELLHRRADEAADRMCESYGLRDLSPGALQRREKPRSTDKPTIMKISPHVSMTLPPRLASLVLFLVGCLVGNAADSLPPLTLQRPVDESGPFSRLQWPAQPGVLYRLQTATNLAATGNHENWRFGDALVADSTNAVLEIRGRSIPNNSVEFYRLAGPPAEIFSVEPAWVDSSDPNAALYLVGQCLPTNATVIINGQSFAATNDGGALRVSLNSLPPGTPIIGTIYVVDNATGATNSEYKLTAALLYAAQPSLEMLQGPPTEPPASPVAGVRRAIHGGGVVRPSQTAASVAYTWRDDGDKGFDGDGSAARTVPAFEGQTVKARVATLKGDLASLRPGSDPVDDDCDGEVDAPTGEFRCEQTDLAIPGAMLDFAWTRSYRSRTGPDTAQGAGWDFSFNVSLTQNGDGTLTLRPGNGRADTFYPDGTNGWIRDEYFCEIHDLDRDGMPEVVVFADTSRWLFSPPGSPAVGKLAQIVDRNGNAIMLNYDGAGRLASIVDDLGRTNTVAYNPAGLIASVTDFTGRAVRYEYDGNGDLVACVSPATSYFPGGITNRYTYSSGYMNAAENHLLLSIIDGRGQIQHEHVYQHNQTDLSFLRCVSVQSGTNPPAKFTYLPVTPSPANGFATTKVIIRDEVGNVTESFYDSRQRCVRLLEYTGRAPNLFSPTTETQNRPVNKLRAGDPDYFETQWSWNPDSLCTLELRGDGSRTEIVHQRVQDHNSSRSNKTASRRHEGNVLVVRERAGSAGGGDLDGDGVPDYTERVWRFEYDPRFGSPGQARLGGGAKGVAQVGLGVAGNRFGPPSSRVQDHNSSRSNKTASAIDTDFDRDESDDIARLTTGGTRVQDHNSSRSNKTASSIDTDFDGDNTSIVRGGLRDSSCQSGLCTDGFVTSVTDPRGNMTTAEYDSTGNRTKSIKQGHYAVANVHDEVAGLYNSRGQLTTITNAPDADGYRRVDTFSYHASGPQAGYLESIAIDEPGVHLTSTFEYDARGNLTRVVDANTNDWLYAYDALDRCVTRQTPNNSFGERTTTQFAYDANGNLVQTTTDLRDENNNPRHTIVWKSEVDLGNRCTAVIRQVSPGVFITNRFDYDAVGNLTAVQSPLAVSGSDPHAIAQFEYDERGLIFREIAAPGSGNSPTNEWSYDARGRVRILRGPEYLRVTTCAYDGFGQPVSITDPLGNVTSFGYDRNGNLTRVRCYGETNDAPGSAGNRLLAETRYAYDSRDRCVLRWEPFFDVFTGEPIGDGAATNKFAYAPNGACTSVTDAKGHTTRFRYDTAGRLSAVSRGLLEAGPFDEGVQIVSFTYDACDNVLSVTETNRPDGGGAVQVFATTYAYDALNRLTRCVDNVGNTNRYAYDSLGRCVRATDPQGNDSAFALDDLGRCRSVAHFVGAVESGITINTSHVEYDVNDRCVSVTDANTNTTTYANDSLGRRTSITQADGTVCSLVWSPRSNLLRVQDANGTVISNRFDLLDRCVRRDITPGAGVAGTTTFEMFGYDGASRLVSAVNDASTNSFAYDSLGNQKAAIRDGWQMLGAFDTVGNCLSLTYPSGRVVTYTYDALDQVKSVSTSADGGLPPVILATFDYDGPGRLSKITRANGVDTRLQWDGLLSPPNAAGDFGWGEVSGISHRVTGSGVILDRRACAYDRNQNKTSRAQTTPFFTGGPTTTNLFAYDALDRLIGFTRGTGTPDELIRGYQLDPNGNRQVVLSNGVAQAYTMEATIPPGDFQMSQYTTTPFGAQAFDENGNLAVRGSAVGGMQFVYDYANRLVAVNDLGTGAPVAAYVYDALGRRIANTLFSSDPMTPPVTTEFVHHTSPSPCQANEVCGNGLIEERVNGVVGQVFVRVGSRSQADRRVYGTESGRRFYCLPEVGDEVLVAFNQAGQPQYYHCDDLGSTLALTDAKGSVIERYDYDDYGQPTFLTSDGFPLIGSDGQPATASAAGNPFLFHGLEWDAETGFYHANSGGFDPQTGKSINGINGGLPNRISMNVTVPKQTQGATFGERVNAGLHAAGGALAQSAARFRPAFFDVFADFAPAGRGASDFMNDAALVNPAPVADTLAHELAHVFQQRAGSPQKTKHDTVKNSIQNMR